MKNEANVKRLYIRTFGWPMVRAAIRKQKYDGKHRDRKTILQLPKRVFDLFPYNWMDSEIFEDLRIYPGPYMNIVKENPSEFVRDFSVYK